MKGTRHIVVVDDEPNIGASLRLILEGDGYRVTVCDSAARFQAQRALGRTDLYVLDVRLPDGNGIDLLRSLRDDDDPTPAVMISGHGTIRDAVEATRSGAFDFLEKPLARDRVLLVVKNALERSDLEHENQRFRELVGDAPKMIESPDIKVGRSQRTGSTCAVSPAHLSSSNNHRLNTLRRLLAAAEQAPKPERGLRRRPSTEARKYCSGRSQKNP